MRAASASGKGGSYDILTPMQLGNHLTSTAHSRDRITICNRSIEYDNILVTQLLDNQRREQNSANHFVLVGNDHTLIVCANSLQE